MNNILDITKPLGGIIAIIDYKAKPREVFRFPNTVLNQGRIFLAKSLIQEFQGEPTYVANMIFGNGGTSQGSKQIVNADRNSLFGATKIKKPVIAQIDPQEPTQAIFTSVITFEEVNGEILNEMALQLSDGNLFSMATFPDLGKSEQMQITWNWRLSFV